MITQKPDPRNFSDPKDFLSVYWSWKKTVRPKYSLDMWARKMGFRNHSLLSMFISGKRDIQPRHLSALRLGLSLSTEERDYFEFLVGLKNAKSALEREVFESRLRPLIKDSRQMIFKDFEEFKMISNPLHITILEMTNLNDFVCDANWIASRLEEPSSPTEINDAIKRLTNLGFLISDTNGVKKCNSELTFSSKKSSQAVQSYHKQVMKMAYNAIERQTRSERILHSFAFAIDTKRLEEAEPLIMEFRSKLEEKLGRVGGDEAYQCNIQLFRLTRKMRWGVK